MELALNLTWVCLALAGFAMLAFNLSGAPEPGTRQQPSNRQKIVAMTCALIILFFVVSMTDDLHDQEVAVEESRLLRVTCASASPLVSAPHSVPPFGSLLFLALILSSIACALPSVRRLLEPLRLPFTPERYSRSLFGRAPPAPLA
jgi:hypothetical protein